MSHRAGANPAESTWTQSPSVSPVVPAAAAPATLIPLAVDTAGVNQHNGLEPPPPLTHETLGLVHDDEEGGMTRTVTESYRAWTILSALKVSKLRHLCKEYNLGTKGADARAVGNDIQKTGAR